MKKLITFILVLAMALPASVFAENAEESSPALNALDERNIQLNDQTVLYSGWYENGDALLSENYMVYEPGEGIQPLVCFGNDVSGAAGFSRIVEIESEAGRNVVAGINGDYFTMATGVAMGLIIKNGRVCSSERGRYESIGFKADGSVIIGSPCLNVGFTDETSGYSLHQLTFNKTLENNNGLVVFSKDFGAANEAGKHRSIVVDIDDDVVIAPGTTVNGVIESIETLESAKALEAGKLVLSINEATEYVSVLANIDSMNVGDIVSLTFSVDEQWLDVVNAVGAERRLLKDGEPAENILADSEAGKDKTRDPRTAFGIKADGSVILYTADGRDKNHSAGLTYLELALRLKALGCVDAVNLDGGGSTQIHAAYPGDQAVTLLNKNSGTGLRRCADYLCLVNSAEPTGQLARLNIYPYKERVLAGASLPMNVKGSDDGWYPVDITGSIPVWSISDGLGTIENNTFVAGNQAGTALVSAYVGNASGTAEIEVITRPDEFNVTYADGKALPDKLYVYSGDTVQMKVETIYKRRPLIADDNCFTWTVSEGLGTVEKGLFTSADTELAEGFIAVTAGDVSRSIPVTVYKDESAPQISGEISGNLLMASVTDNCPWNFGKTNISVRYDGSKIAFNYTTSGDVYAALPDGDGDMHHLVVEAVDALGNKSRLGFEVPAVIPQIGEDGSEYVKEYVFRDLNGDNGVTPYAEYLSRRGLMAGKLSAEGLFFDPDACLTRQEFAAVISNVLHYDPYAYESVDIPFTDTEAISSWAALFVKAAYKEGSMAGKAAADGSLRFDPQGKITRQEAITVLAKMLGDGYKSEELTCSDASSVSSWALSFMELALKNGITKTEDGLLRPLDNITRGELALMLYAMD